MIQNPVLCSSRSKYWSLPFLVYIFRPSCWRIRGKAIFVYSKLQIFYFLSTFLAMLAAWKKKIAISKRKTTAHFIISIFCAKYCDFHANVFFFLLCGQIKKIQFNVYKNTLPSNTNCNFMILLQSCPYRRPISDFSWFRKDI